MSPQNRLHSRRRWHLVFLGLAALFFMCVIGLAMQAQYRASLEWMQAMHVAGKGALTYFRQEGRPPGRVEELIDGGFFRFRNDGVYLNTYPLPEGVALTDHVVRVKLSFPLTRQGYNTAGERVVATASGQELVVVSVPVGAIWSEHKERENRALAREWFELAGRTATQPAKVP